LFSACEFRAPLWFWDVNVVLTLDWPAPDALAMFIVCEFRARALVSET